MVSDLGFDGRECVWFPNSNCSRIHWGICYHADPQAVLSEILFSLWPECGSGESNLIQKWLSQVIPKQEESFEENSWLDHWPSSPHHFAPSPCFQSFQTPH